MTQEIIQITFNNILAGVTILVFLLSILQFILAKWLEIRLEKSIEHEYAKKIEDYKFSQLQREKASLIANFFSTWIKYRGLESTILTKEELISYYQDLNKMSIEISLWIKDEKLLTEIMSLLGKKETARDLRSLTGEVRKLILEIGKDNFNPLEIIIWPNEEISTKLFK